VIQVADHPFPSRAAIKESGQKNADWLRLALLKAAGK